MKRRSVQIITVVLLCACCFVSCSKGKTDDDSSSMTPTKQIENEHINSADRIELEDAYDQLKNNDSKDKEEEALFDKLGLLINCSGRFLQQSEETNNIYTADVSFYLVKGEVYCSINYTGYMGEISDGIVTESEEGDYSFEAFPKGDYYGREQDFKIYFSNEKLYISWTTLGDKVCEYTLYRGDGSAENNQERHQTFEETGMLDTINETIDKTFSDYPHSVIYDKDFSSIRIAVQFENMSSYFSSDDPELIARWQPLVDQIVTLDKQLYDVVSVLQYQEDGIWWPYVYDLHFYIVDKLNSSGKYRESDMLLWVENGIVKYNIADKKPDSSDKNSTKSTKPTTKYTTKDTTNDLIVTYGERNALESAKNYLSFMAFSYSGLIEQLEYEGYSHSEAVYAADNCGADWNQQAVKKAKEYLEVMSFSRSELIEQLEYEGFTHEQAVYGVDRVY